METTEDFVVETIIQETTIIMIITILTITIMERDKDMTITVAIGATYRQQVQTEMVQKTLNIP